LKGVSAIIDSRTARNSWILKRRDVGVVDRARLESEPSVARGSDGTTRLALMTASAPGNTHVWALPVHAGRVTGEPERLTTNLFENQDASISTDGRMLVFSSDRQRNQDIVIRDLRAGTEKALTATDVNEFSPFLGTDTSKVLYYIFRPDQKPSFSFWVVSAAGGVARQVCADCDGPLYGWSSDATKVIWRDQPSDRPGRIRVRDIESGTDVVLMEHPRFALTLPRISPDDPWMLFQTVINQRQRQIFLAPIHGWQAAPASSWIPLTNGRTPDRNAVWAPDGNLVYFLSERDGFRCFWAQRLDAQTKRPEGEPFAVRHFHQARLSYDPDEFAGLQLSVGPDELVYPSRERTGNIWLAKTRIALSSRVARAVPPFLDSKRG
jgi:hypothetical protein